MGMIRSETFIHLNLKTGSYGSNKHERNLQITQAIKNEGISYRHIINK